MNTTNDVGEYIRRRYRELGHNSLDEVAQAIGVSRRTLYNWIESGTEIKISNMLKLSRALKVHPIEILRLSTKDFLQYPVHNQPKVRFDDAGFIDETVPDGSAVGSGARFEKVWTVRNIGSSVWEGRKLVCQNEHEQLYVKLNGDYVPVQSCILTPDVNEILIPNTHPNETIDLKVTFQAPPLRGRSISIWNVVDQHGELCYPDTPGYWCEVVISGF